MTSVFCLNHFFSANDSDTVKIFQNVYLNMDKPAKKPFISSCLMLFPSHEISHP